MPGYSLIRAARYLGVPPWELNDRPIIWRNLALAIESAENWVECDALKAAQKKR